MQKFIVTSDCRLKFGNVNMHKDLLASNESCIGGGVYEFDYVGSKMLLSGRSYDFGRVKWADVDILHVPTSLQGIDILYCDLPITDYVFSIDYY